MNLKDRSIDPRTSLSTNGIWNLPTELGLQDEIDQLREYISQWINSANEEVTGILHHQLFARAKYYRPVTIFACHRAVSKETVSEQLLVSSAALELIHNVSLIIDDILDRSRYRRGKLSLHCRFGSLPALMTAGYINASAYKLVASDSYAIGILAELVERLGVAECLQWRLRRRPLGVEDWRAIAGEDTGVMFEACARLGTRDDKLKKFGYLLGILYHGCDDVADVRGSDGLGGGKDQDISDGILTLPAAIATRNPTVAALFRNKDDKASDALVEEFRAALPEAERYLDRLASEARAEAAANSKSADGLFTLVDYTRALSES